ncbi:MAG: YhcH/YjgK/YiaL family protein [Acholeplasma sp.]|nr:YhcH/YjgK/YiaL family protein [Acholeplasma sp.]
MIFDKLSNLHLYSSISSKIPEVDIIIRDVIKGEIKEGKYYFGDDNFYMISLNKNHYYAEELWERHKKYIDIHILIRGSEQLYFSSEMVSTYVEYSNEKDISFHQVKTWNSIILDSDSFIIIFPHEYHQPSIIQDNYDYVQKIVFKINRNYFKEVNL